MRERDTHTQECAWRTSWSPPETRNCRRLIIDRVRKRAITSKETKTAEIVESIIETRYSVNKAISSLHIGQGLR